VNGFFRLGTVILLASVGGGCLNICRAERGGQTAAEKLGWRLSVQAYTFNRFTFFQAVDKTASMGIKCIEMYPEQQINDENDAVTHFSMDAGTRRKILNKLDAAGVKLVNYGVVSNVDAAEWRQLFEFAKAMGIETITAEPDPERMDIVESLCEEFKINVAIHNHPKPSRYWNPDTVLETVRDCSSRIGACADTGHWMRSGLDPVECLKKLEGRIVSLHFKDLDKKGSGAHDMPWGQGAGNAKAMLAELNRQGFKGVFSVEYEYHWDNSMPEIRQCAEYFNTVAAELVKSGK